jgi:hypothetical protein
MNRIYRARNLTVHEGADVPAVGFLLDNLHFYFSITLSRILHGMVIHPDWGIPESIAYWNTRSGYLLSTLDAHPADLRVNDIFVSPHTLGDARLWPPPVFEAALGSGEKTGD